MRAQHGKERVVRIEKVALTYIYIYIYTYIYIHTYIHILPCVKQIASGKLLYNTGSSAQGSVMT